MPLPTTFAGTSARGEGLFNYISLGGNYWVTTLTDTYTSPSSVARGIAVDSSGNVYVCGYGYNSSGATVQSISKWNNSGTIQWQRTLTDTYSSPTDLAYGIAVDSSGNVYVCGSATNSSGRFVQSISKYNTSGTIQWQRTLKDNWTKPSDIAFGIAVDSSGNVYVCGRGLDDSSGNQIQSISKWDTSGTIQWQNTLTDTYTTSADLAYGIAVDGSGNVYVCGRGRDSSGNVVQSISKWDTSGTIQWQKTLTDNYTSPNDIAYGITVDSSGNVYVCGSGTNSSGRPVQSISKYNTSGTIQWQRTLTDSYATPNDVAYGITVDSSGNVYVCGSGRNSSGNYVQFIAKLPADGSKTGTYSGTNFGITYAASSWTAATSSWTSAASTWTDATSSLTSASSSWTSATSTWTTDKALIP